MPKDAKPRASLVTGLVPPPENPRAIPLRTSITIAARARTLPHSRRASLLEICVCCLNTADALYCRSKRFYL